MCSKLEKQNQSVAKSDFITNKIMLVFILAFVMSIVLMLINRGLANPSTFMGTYYTLYGLGILGTVGVIVGIVKGILDRRHDEEPKPRYITGTGIVVCSLVLVLTAVLLLFRNYSASIHLLYILVPALAIYYLICRIFPREFSALTALAAVIALYFWRFARFNQGTTAFIVIQCLLLALCLLAAACLLLLKKNDGVFTLGKRNVRVLESGAEYGASLVFLGLLALTLLAAFFVPAGWVLYLSFLTLAIVFVMAVYFAVRMM